MDQPGKRLSHDDLPTPESPKFDEAQRRDRKWRLFRGTTVFLVIYASIHKFFVPVFLKFTPVLRREYAEIDYWFVPGWIFLWLILRARKIGHQVSIFAGVLVAHGILDVISVSQGHAVGWLAISHLLSSVPLAILSVALLGQFGSSKQVISAWAVAIPLLAAGIHFNFVRQAPIQETSKIQAPRVSSEMLKDISEKQSGGLLYDKCANRSMIVRHQEVRNIPSVDRINISACGISPSLRSWHGQPIEVNNELGKSINVHVLVRSDKAERRNLNVLVGPHATVKVKNFHLTSKEAAFVYSDAFEEMGGSAILPSDGELSWVFSRLPLKIEVLE